MTHFSDSQGSEDNPADNIDENAAPGKSNAINTGCGRKTALTACKEPMMHKILSQHNEEKPRIALKQNKFFLLILNIV